MNTQHAEKLIIQNSANECEKLTVFLRDKLKSIDLPDETYNDLRLAIEEAFINIVSYAYENKEKDSISFELITSNKQIHLTFIDHGIAFNPLTDSNKNIDNNDNCDGGMGIHLIKSLTDHQEYKRIDQRNVFTLTKNYTQQNLKH